ncbi:MAG: hypothetical protein R3E68_00600 [Burkholderiaceae bacterium]
MVERRGWAGWVTHAILIVGIAIICFPIYLTFVASTVTPGRGSAQPPLPLLPGPHLVENYGGALVPGSIRRWPACWSTARSWP